MRKKFFEIGLGMVILGGASFCGTLETSGSGSPVVPAILFILGIVLTIINWKGCEEILEEDNRKSDEHRSARPRFLH